jgi:hypothetical protein
MFSDFFFLQNAPCLGKNAPTLLVKYAASTNSIHLVFGITIAFSELNLNVREYMQIELKKKLKKKNHSLLQKQLMKVSIKKMLGNGLIENQNVAASLSEFYVLRNSLKTLFQKDNLSH